MCITALGTGRLLPSSPGRAGTTMTRPAGEDGPASEPRDGWWATSISIRATTQTSSANAPDFFSSLLEIALDPKTSNELIIVVGCDRYRTSHRGGGRRCSRRTNGSNGGSDVQARSGG